MLYHLEKSYGEKLFENAVFFTDDSNEGRGDYVITANTQWVRLFKLEEDKVHTNQVVLDVNTLDDPETRHTCKCMWELDLNKELNGKHVTTVAVSPNGKIVAISTINDPSRLKGMDQYEPHPGVLMLVHVAPKAAAITNSFPNAEMDHAATTMSWSNDCTKFAFANHRGDVYVYDTVIDTIPYEGCFSWHRIIQLCWSANDGYLGILSDMHVEIYSFGKKQYLMGNVANKFITKLLMVPGRDDLMVTMMPVFDTEYNGDYTMHSLKARMKEPYVEVEYVINDLNTSLWREGRVFTDANCPSLMYDADRLVSCSASKSCQAFFVDMYDFYGHFIKSCYLENAVTPVMISASNQQFVLGTDAFVVTGRLSDCVKEEKSNTYIA